MEIKTHAEELQKEFLSLSEKFEAKEGSLAYFVESDGTGVAIYNLIEDEYLLNFCARIIKRVSRSQDVSTTVVIEALRRLVPEDTEGSQNQEKAKNT